jgi:hypothetical protein
VQAISWQGAALPVSPDDGPARFTATRASGFARNPLGAALAAVHISTHIDAYTGPAVFTSAIRQQVVAGNRAKKALLTRTRASYAAAAEQMGVSGGAPILVPTGAVQSWRIKDFAPDGDNAVDLLVTTPTGEQVVYRIDVRWSHGDWRLVLARSADDQLFPVEAAGDVADFAPFVDYPGGG